MPTSSQESNERKKVGMLVPPPILLVALIAICVAAHAVWFEWFAFSWQRTVLGALALLVSAGLVMASGRVFKRAGTPVRPVSPATVVVRQGPYRISRNPMYLGMLGLLAGLGILSGSYCFVAAMAVFAAVVHFGVVLPEERYLEALHGEAYRQYKRQVRRWL